MAATQAIEREKQAKVHCVCCDTENVNHRGCCSRCFAPLELTRSVLSRGTPPKFLTVLGASGAGKTVYLGLLLDILSKGIRGLQGLPNGSFSVSMQQDTVTALQNYRFPEKTPSEADSWRWVHCEVTNAKKRGRYLDIITPDLAGETIALEVAQPGTSKTIQTIVLRSEAVLLLIDSQQARDAGREEDFFAMKLLSYLCGLHKLKRGKLEIPMAIVLTKADICPEVSERPLDFSLANLPTLVRYCERNLTNYKFFATSVVGSSATLINDAGYRVRVPLHIEPYGVIEPLEWIMSHL